MGSNSNQSHESRSIFDAKPGEKSKCIITHDRLNNLRNFFTFASNLIVLGLGLIIFTTVDDKQAGFLIIAILSLFLGLAASIFFLCVVK